MQSNKQRVINKLPQKWEDLVLSLMSVNEKLILGGSLCLHILNILKYDWKTRIPDLDFSIIEPLSKDEFTSFTNFFELTPVNTSGYHSVDEENISSKLNLLDNELILLEHVPSLDSLDSDLLINYYKLDIFNKNYLRKKDWFELDYFGTPLKLTHPSLIFSAKMKYATDVRVGKQFKHFQDIQNIDWINYFKIIRGIIPYYVSEKINDYELGRVLSKYIFKVEFEVTEDMELPGTELSF